MKCSPIIYINPDDPRTFVYKHERYKWFGVTLNFAQRKSLLVPAAAFPPLLCPPLVVRELLTLRLSGGRVGLVLGSIGILYLAVLCVSCFRGAARDLRRHPGNRSARP